jgi:hypothetical protein
MGLSSYRLNAFIAVTEMRREQWNPTSIER